MDFKSLSRKDLQTLCKKNLIPANITNVAMAEALAALQEVAGIEEFLNPIESEPKQSEERIDIGSSCRTSTRRKPVKELPIAQSIIRTRRGKMVEMADQENNNLNILSTPSLPSNRRRAPVPSARKNLETHSSEGKEEEKDQNDGDQKRSDVLATPSMPKSQRKVSVLGSTRRKTEAHLDKSSVQGTCSTRRSMRLLEKTMENLSLMECGSMELVVADKLFDELPERKEFCEQEINEIDSKEALGLAIVESDDPESMNETKDMEEEQADDGKDGKEPKEKVKMEDEKEEDHIITNKEPQDEVQSEAAICEPEEKIQFEAAIEEQHSFTPPCNNQFSTENLSQEQVLPAESPLLQEKADVVDITVQREVLIEDSEIITEKTVEFNFEDLVDINVEEVEFQHVNAQDSISEPKMEVQVLSDGETSFKEMVDVDVVESELVENYIQETCNVEEQINDLDSKESFPEPKIEDWSKTDEILVEDSEKIDNFSFAPFAVDQISGQFPRPTAEVSVQESKMSLEIFDDAPDQDEDDTKQNSNEDEEKNLSLRQLRKMVKELHLSIKSNKEKTYGKEQVEKVVRTALQPLSENCMTKEGQEKATTANSMMMIQ